MNRGLAGGAFLVLFFGVMVILVAVTSLGWIVAAIIGAVVGGLVAGAIAERSRG